MAEERQSRYYRVGDLTLDTTTHEICRGRSKIKVPLLSYRLFALLVEQAPAIVGHEEIIKRVWSGRIVAPATITQRVKLLRQALDDDAQQPRYIGLVRGEGYRVTADVQSLEGHEHHEGLIGKNIFRSRRGHGRVMAYLGFGSVAATLAVLSFGQVGYGGPPTPVHVLPEVAVPSLPTSDVYIDGNARAQLAQRYYVAGTLLFDSRNLDMAEENFVQALEIDPELAPAWVGIAGVNFVRYWSGKSTDHQRSMEKQMHALGNALALDPNLVEARIRLSDLYWHMGDADRAEDQLARVLASAPDHPLALAKWAGRAASMGDFDKAADLMRNVVGQEPLSITYQQNLAIWLLAAGNLDEADTAFNRAGAMSPLVADNIKWDRAAIRVLQGRHLDAIALIQDCPRQEERYAILAMAYAGLDRGDESMAMIDQLAALQSVHSIVHLAEVYAFLGDLESAWQALSRIDDLELKDAPDSRAIEIALDRLKHSPFLPFDSVRQEYRKRLVRARQNLLELHRG